MRRSLVTAVLVNAIILGICVQPGFADRANDCVEIVQKVAKVFDEKGAEYAIKAINSKIAYTDKEVYVFALSLNNVVIGHPYKPSLIGKYMSESEDVKGKKYFLEFKEVAEDPGEGWVEYHWNRPGEKEHRFKRTFIKRIPGQDIYIGAGYYPETEQKQEQAKAQVESK